MNEQQWLACTDPKPMLDFLRGKTSDRKLRLFACACCRRIYPLLLPVSQQVLEVSELYADGRISHVELMDASVKNYREANAAGDELVRQSGVAANLAVVDSSRNGLPFFSVVQAASRTAEKAIHVLRLAAEAALACKSLQIPDPEEEQVVQARLLRDILGTPFHTVFLDPNWRTELVLEQAQTIYDLKSFDRFPMLAAALEKAGCSNEDILQHCRSERPHVRGCWVIDLLLGKE